MLLPKHYENLQMLGENTMPKRAYYVPASAQLTGPAYMRQVSDRFQLLNGEWNFKYYESIYDVEGDFYKADYDASAFDKLPVPSVWQNFGYDYHQYTNIRYPIPFDPPYVPQNNPCGAYVTEFEYEKCKEAPRAYLNFEGVDSCFYVWLNGTYVGYSQVSHSSSEFDVTAYVKEGKNRLAVLVLKWCDGTYLEDQDKFRMSGIFRDVFLLKRPEKMIYDYFVDVTTEDGKRPEYADVRIRLKYLDQPCATAIRILTVQGEVIAEAENATAPNEEMQEEKMEDFDLSVRLAIKNPQLWNAESPYLYTLVLETEHEVITDKIGIRKIEIRENNVCINGTVIKFHGVNRHDSDPVNGFAVTLEQMKKDLLIMKRHNVNAIRTSHYPNSPLFYQLCDEYGFYVIDEADIETHGAADIYYKDDNSRDNEQFHWCDHIANNPAFVPVILDRVQKCVQRDKNRPCVVIWSMGNESAYGLGFENALKWTKTFDPGRLTHYEGAWFSKKGRKNDYSNLDLFSRMYASIDEMKAYLDGAPDKPFIQCEYCHAMGNGPGDLEDYFEFFHEHDGVCGGFVWEWCDHGIYKGVADNGKPMYYYGGDHGEIVHDGNFCMDGLVYPDRTPHTGLLEFKNIHRPVRIVSYDQNTGELVLQNYLNFTNTADCLEISYEINCDGNIIAAGMLPKTDIMPQDRASVFLKTAVPKQGKCYLKLYYHTSRESAFATKGYLLGFEEVLLQNEDGRNRTAAELLAQNGAEKAAEAALMVTEDERNVKITGQKFTYIFDKLTGSFTDLEFAGKELLQHPMEVNIWRAPTDNDRNIKWEWMRARYDMAGARAYETHCDADGNGVKIVCVMALLGPATQRMMDIKAIWQISREGVLTVTMDVERTPEFMELPRFGLRLFLPRELNKVTYYGVGPYESYIDKHYAGSHGRYESTVEEMHEDYLRPQENGSHYDCDYVITENGTYGLRAVSEKAFSFNASVYTQEELTAKGHNYELEPSDSTVLCLDYAQNGIGSNSCGPRLDEKYRFDDRSFCYRMKLIPFINA